MEREAPYIIFSDKPGPASLAFKVAAERNSEQMRAKTPDERRGILLLRSELRPTLPDMHIEPVDFDGIPCEWIYRHDADDSRVILYIHGGGWMTGDLTTARMPGMLLAETVPCKVLVAQYRLSPENPFPAGFDDCLKVLDILLETGFSEDRIALFGDSAGGNLSLALLNLLKEKGRKLPNCVGLASPVPDITLESELIKSRDNLIYLKYENSESDICTLYARENDRENPLLSPVFGDLTGLPPILIHAGGDEPLSLDCVAYAKKAYEAGVDVTLKIYREMFHDFTIVGVALKESRDSIKDFAEFYNRHLISGAVPDGQTQNLL